MADLVLKQVVAVIDERTTMVCLRAAGQIKPVDKPFDTLNGPLMEPPFHYGCRSISVPYMRGFVNDARAAANAEVKRRPLQERRYDEDGYHGKIAPLPPEQIAAQGEDANDSLSATPNQLGKVHKVIGERNRASSAENGGPAAVRAVVQGQSTARIDPGAAVIAYADGLSRPLNLYLRTGEVEKGMAQRGLEALNRALRQALKRQGVKLRKPTPVTRGVTRTQGFDPDALQPGMVFFDAGWTSTTYQGDGYPSPTKLRFTVPAGTHALLGEDGELILPPGGVYKVTRVSSRTKRGGRIIDVEVSWSVKP